MATAFKKLRNILTATSVAQPGNPFLEPEVGFKASLNEQTKELKITVIAARHLPTIYGLTRPEGYVVKIKLFPGKETYETQLQKESWPSFNQDFTFVLSSSAKYLQDLLTGRFIVLTVYAILEQPTENKPAKESRLSNSSFRSLFKPELKRSQSSKERVSLYKRRTVGAVTYNLDARGFTQKLRGNLVGTQDIWRVVKSISSGFVDNSKTSENTKGSVELTLTYSESEDGKNDMFKLAVSRLRFSMKTMETHENYTGSLYLKMKIYEHDVPVAKWRSTKFEPTISHKLDSATAVMYGTVQKCNLHAVLIEIRLMCKNKLGKKTQLGYVNIRGKDAHWEQAVDTPCNSYTMWHNFL